MLSELKRRAANLRRELGVLRVAISDPRTPRLARIIAIGTIAYALSPIDLIPDFIPILGYLDDLVLVPAGVSIALRMIPREVMDDARRKADENWASGSGGGKAAAAVIILIWAAVIGWLGYRIYQLCTG